MIGCEREKNASLWGWAIEWRMIDGLIAPMTKLFLTYPSVTIVK